MAAKRVRHGADDGRPGRPLRGLVLLEAGVDASEASAALLERVQTWPAGVDVVITRPVLHWGVWHDPALAVRDMEEAYRAVLPIIALLRGQAEVNVRVARDRVTCGRLTLANRERYCLVVLISSRRARVRDAAAARQTVVLRVSAGRKRRK